MDWDIVYPVILLGKQGVWVACDSEQLITTQKSLLRAGLYNDRLMIDSAGWARHLKKAREPAVGLGLLSRWRTLWNPSALIRVELVFDSELTSVSVDEFKERLLESFAGRPQNLAEWNAGTINFDQLNQGMRTSTTFAKIFSLVREYTTIRPDLR